MQNKKRRNLIISEEYMCRGCVHFQIDRLQARPSSEFKRALFCPIFGFQWYYLGLGVDFQNFSQNLTHDAQAGGCWFVHERGKWTTLELEGEIKS